MGLTRLDGIGNEYTRGRVWGERKSLRIGRVGGMGYVWKEVSKTRRSRRCGTLWTETSRGCGWAEEKVGKLCLDGGGGGRDMR